METQNGVIYELSVKGYNPWIPVFLAKGSRVNIELTLLPQQSMEISFSGDCEKRINICLLYDLLKIHRNGILLRYLL